MINFLATAILAVLLSIAAPARGTDCVSTTDALNRITSTNPGSQVIAFYESLDAQMYIRMLNSSPWGPPFIVGTTVIVMTAPSYNSVMVLVFHEYPDRVCASVGQALGVVITAEAHAEWHSIVQLDVDNGAGLEHGWLEQADMVVL